MSSDPMAPDLSTWATSSTDPELAPAGQATPPAGAPDPTSLPLFAPAPRRPGRVRGSFSMRQPPADALLAQSSSVRPVELTSINGGESFGDGAAGAGLLPARRIGPGAFVTLDWALVAAFRQRAADQLSAATAADGQFDAGTQRARGRSIIVELLEAEAAERVASGQPAWDLDTQDAMVTAVFDQLFGLGRLQPLVDDDQIENIIITGCDQVWLEMVDGRLIRGPAVAESDQELIDFLVFVASRSQVNARVFSEAQPTLHLRLDGGARLAAAAWVTPRPSVVIRRHRLRRVTLDDMVDLGALSEVAASFLAAAVRAGKTIVVAGSQGAGKTTLVRALCAAIPKHESIGTFETEYELFLNELPDVHPIVHAWEARPGSGERGPDGRPVGEYTLTQAMHASHRFNLLRQIVGEVRGEEVLAMLKAMQSSNGSISTTHAPTARAAIDKLVTCAMEAGSQVTYQYAVRMIAAAVNIVVHVHLETTPLADGSAQRSRWVSEIIVVEPGEQALGYAATSVFRAAPGSRVALPSVLPDHYRELEAQGFDVRGFYDQQATS